LNIFMWFLVPSKIASKALFAPNVNERPE